MAKMKFNRSFSVTRVVSRLVYTILALYVGGIIMTVFGDVMNQTASGFYDGLTLIGWTLDDTAWGTTSLCCQDQIEASCVTAGTNETAVTGCLVATNDGGVLGVIGIIAMAGVVMEFIKFQ